MRRPSNQQPPELNLAPIMNMVVILIPLLLLSVVFLSVGVINVTAPSGVLDGTPTDDAEPPLELTVAISYDGFIVSTRDGVKPPLPGCPEGPVTVCLTKEVDVQQRFGESKAAFEANDIARGDEALDEASGAYDWKGLYETLATVKANHQDETTVRITGDPNIPYMMIVRTMDLARFELESSSFANSREMWSAKKKRALFPDPVLAVVR